MNNNKYSTANYCFHLTFLLVFVQVILERPIILAERFLKGFCWIEIFLIASFGAIVAYKCRIR